MFRGFRRWLAAIIQPPTPKSSVAETPDQDSRSDCARCGQATTKQGLCGCCRSEAEYTK